MSLKLYWNPKNPTHQLIPIVLVATGVQYEDIRIKEEGPYNGKILPYIENAEGKILDKTLAIAKFYAKRKNYMGKDEWELYSIEKGISLISKIVRMLSNILNRKCDKSEWDKNQEVYLQHIEKMISENDHGFLVTKGVTLTDLYFLVMMNYLKFTTFSKTLETHPNFAKVKEKVLSTLPPVKEYLEKP